MMMTAEWLGGRPILHADINSELDLTKAVRKGLPTGSVQAVAKRGRLSAKEISQIISLRTLGRRTAAKQLLTRDESDKLVRIARVMAKAEETFEDIDTANEWMRRKNRALQNLIPMDLLDTDSGARLVEQVLERIAYGVFS